MKEGNSTMEAQRTLRTQKGLVVQTTMSDAEAIERLKLVPTGFAQELVRKARKYRLSESQWCWIHKLANEVDQPPEPEPPAAIMPVESVEGIKRLFAVAQQHVKWPKVRLTVDGHPVVLGIAGSRSKEPGTINVTDGGPYGENRWFGRIRLDGTFHRGRACTNGVYVLLKAFAEDPAGVASEHGRLTGHCCFCGTKLSDERSIAVGYGGTCAKHYGLPWGNPNRFGLLDAIEEVG